MFCSISRVAGAQARDVELRFLPPDASEVLGYIVWAEDMETQVESAVDVGYVAPDPDGVARTGVLLAADRSYRVGMTAYNDAGQSARSNDLVIDAVTPICDVAACDDGNPCTAAYCDKFLGCSNTPLPTGTLCDDGYIDTVDDQCVEGVCEGISLACRDNIDCDDGNVCNGSEVCEGGTACLEGIPLECGEATACTVPRCDALVGCISEDQPDGTPCDDGSADTQNDSCQAGVCSGVRAVEPTLAVEALSPGTLSAGRHTATIHGQGFVLGAKLSFLNGEGRPPKVKSLRLVDDRRLEATLDVSRKGPKRPSVFDAKVTSPDGSTALLSDALRIER